MADDDTRDDDDCSGPIPPLEWVIAAIGLVLVVVCLAFLSYRGLTHAPGPPDVEVRTIAVRRVGDRYHVRFRAENRGDSAAEVVIRGELAAGGEREMREALIELFPAGSSREGGLFFVEDPARGQLVLHAVSYQDP
jgi:uncharacterized protein (TIGR02588 family)